MARPIRKSPCAAVPRAIGGRRSAAHSRRLSPARPARRGRCRRPSGCAPLPSALATRVRCRAYPARGSRPVPRPRRTDSYTPRCLSWRQSIPRSEAESTVRRTPARLSRSSASGTPSRSGASAATRRRAAPIRRPARRSPRVRSQSRYRRNSRGWGSGKLRGSAQSRPAAAVRGGAADSSTQASPASASSSSVPLKSQRTSVNRMPPAPPF